MRLDLKKISIFLLIIFLGLGLTSVCGGDDGLFYSVNEQKSPIEEKLIHEQDKKKDGFHLKPSERRYFGFGNKIRIRERDVFYEDLSLINSVIIVEGTLNGGLNVVFGDVEIIGHVNGDINIFGGNLILKDSAVVNGNISFIGDNFRKDNNAIVNGNMITRRSRMLNLIEPFVTFLFKGGPEFKLFYSFLWYVVRLGLVLLILYVFQGSVLRIRNGLKESPGMMLLIGIGAVLALSGSALVSFLSIFLIPLAILVIIFTVISLFYSYSILCSIIGDRASAILKLKKTNRYLSAILGYILLSLINLIPKLGFVLIIVAECFILGSILITRFGTRNYLKSGAENELLETGEID